MSSVYTQHPPAPWVMGLGGKTVPLQDLGLLLPFLEDDPKFSGVTYSRFPLPWLI